MPQGNKNVVGNVWGAIPDEVKTQLIQGLMAQLMGLLGGLFNKKKKDPIVVVNPTLPPGFEEEEIIAPPKPVPVVEKIFSASQLNIMDVNGEGYNPNNAVGWGSYLRYDSNPKDQFGSPLPFELIDPASPKCVVDKVEWKALWDGEPGSHSFHINVGGNLWNNSNGYAVSLKIFKEDTEDNKRHTLDVWVTYHLKNGGTVDSNEVRVEVD